MVRRGKKSKIIKKCIKSWRKKCPDYKIIEWNENNIDLSSNQYIKEAYSARKWAFVSDYVRLKVIYEHGGFYLDTDVELIKSLDELAKYDCILSMQDDKYINTGIGFGAKRIMKLLNHSWIVMTGFVLRKGTATI